MQEISASFRAHRTRSTLLASALYAVGVNFFEREPLVHFKDERSGREYTVWQFEPKSRDGKYVTSELAAAWNDDEWFKANPDHPFAYVQAALDMRQNLVDVIKQNKPMVKLRRDGKTWMVPEGSKLHKQLA